MVEKQLLNEGGHNSVGRVSASQAEGRGFESRHPLETTGLAVLMNSDDYHGQF